MTIEQPNVIDGMGIDEVSGEAVLIISDHLAWDGREHLEVLAAKIDAYVHAITSGQIDEGHPSSRGRVKVIQLVHAHAPSESDLAFLKSVDDQLRSIEVGFRHSFLPGS